MIKKNRKFHHPLEVVVPVFVCIYRACRVYNACVRMYLYIHTCSYSHTRRTRHHYCACVGLRPLAPAADRSCPRHDVSTGPKGADGRNECRVSRGARRVRVNVLSVYFFFFCVRTRVTRGDGGGKRATRGYFGRPGLVEREGATIDAI